MTVAVINGNPEFYTICHGITKSPYISPASLNGSISQAIFNKKMLVCFVMNYAYFSCLKYSAIFNMK